MQVCCRNNPEPSERPSGQRAGGGRGCPGVPVGFALRFGHNLPGILLYYAYTTVTTTGTTAATYSIITILYDVFILLLPFL
mgnify:CR=1 FL=1